MELEKKQSYKYIFKFIVVGSVAVGKSSLINRFVKEKFSESHLATLGVDLASKIINVDN